MPLNFFNKSDTTEVELIQNAITRGERIDSMQDSTVYLSYDRELCRQFGYEHGAAIKEYKHKGMDYHKKVLLYQQATEVCYNSIQNDPQTIETPFGTKNVKIVPIDRVIYDEKTQKTYAVSAFIPGYNMAYRDETIESNVPENEQMTHEQSRLFNYFITRVQHQCEYFLDKTHIIGISLSAANFMLPIQKVRSPSTDIFITDMSDDLSFMGQY